MPLRVRLRSSLPLARNSRLQAPRKFSPQTTSPLQFRLWFPLLFPAPQIPRPLSVGITAATFRTSFNALAFNVAAPRRATQERKFSPLTWICYRQYLLKFPSCEKITIITSCCGCCKSGYIIMGTDIHSGAHHWSEMVALNAHSLSSLHTLCSH